MKKILAALVIVPLAAFGGVKGYAWYRVKQSMDEIVVAAQPFATVTYGGVGSSFSGRVSVKDINIASPAIGGDLRIEEVAISAPDLLTLLNMEEELKANRTPDRMGLHIKHMSIPMEALASLEAQESDAEKVMDAAYALGCGDVERIGLAEMVEMGYPRFDISLDASVERTGVHDIVKTVMELVWYGGGSYTFTARVPDARAVGQFLASEVPPSMSIQIDNAGFHDKLIDFCSGKAGVEPDAYVEQHMKLIRERLQGSGISLSESMYAAYEKYLGEGEPITISLNPTDMSSLANVGHYSPKDIPAVIGLELSIGDETIDYEIDWNEKKSPAALAAKPIEKPQVEQAEKATPKRRGYVDVDKTTLGEYLYGTVKVETVTGRRFQGKLLKTTDTSIQMRVKLAGGAATLPIRLSDISSVKVYR